MAKRTTKKKTGDCVACRRSFELRADGTVPMHEHTAMTGVHCPGAGEAPAD